MLPRFLNKFIRKMIELTSYNPVKQEEYDKIINENTLNKPFIELSKEVASEGIVLLKNDNNVLPISKNDIVSVFGRCQIDYFYCGYGSGGDVKVPYVVNPIEGLRNANIKINEELYNKYKVWTSNPKNYADPGFWGHWPFYFDEMPLKDEDYIKASTISNKALYIIGRAAGEDRDCKLNKGSFYLTNKEEKILSKLSYYFKDVIVVLNTGNVIDMSFVNKYNIKGLILAHQGGMESGNALASILNGTINPSGKLNTTICETYKEYPTYNNFGHYKRNNYKEDIYLGYRYFDTFNIKPLFKFGYGLSYSNFSIELNKIESVNNKFNLEVVVNNISNIPGKEVVELFLEKPIGKLGSAKYELVSFEKTNIIKSNEKELVKLSFNLDDFSKYDDMGIINAFSYLHEAGEYKLYLGSSLDNLKLINTFKLEKDIILNTTPKLFVLDKSHQFKRFFNDNGELKLIDNPKFDIDLKERIINNLPEEIKSNTNKYTLLDVKNKKCSMDEFIGSLKIEDLMQLSLGEGKMHSSLGTEGNGGALGGVSNSLRERLIPPYIGVDGPSGLRLAYKSVLMPIGACISSTWNKALIEKLGFEYGKEALSKNIDCVFGPGMNIYRDPLNGRNFEYFSEDPLLSGLIAASITKGINKSGIDAVPKHYFANNQETNRIHNDSTVSVRALREIYLRNFKFMVNNSNPRTIMCSYNLINGIYSHYNFDGIEYLRKEVGYNGLFMTDWWMRYRKSKEFKGLSGNGYRIRSRVNILMPGFINGFGNNKYGNSLEKSYKNGSITKAELQRNAKEILEVLIDTVAFDRFLNSKKIKVDIIKTKYYNI